MRFKTLLATLIALCFFTPAQAVTYRWVDENGVTVYSQTPPANGKATIIHTEIKSPKPAPAATAPAENTQADKSATPDGEKGDQKQQQLAESEKIRQSNCQAAKSNLEVIKNLGNRLLKTADGVYMRLTDEQRQERIAEAQQHIKEFCNEQE